MEVLEEFIHFYASNCSTETYQKDNKAAHFTILLDKPMYFANPEEWQVGLLHIMLPKLHYNIYEPFNQNILEIRRFQDENEPEDKSVLVCSVSVEPGFYSVKQFCEHVNHFSRKCLENSLRQNWEIIKHEDGTYAIVYKEEKEEEEENYDADDEEEGEGSPSTKKSRKTNNPHLHSHGSKRIGVAKDGEIYSNTRLYEMVKHIEDPDERAIASEKLESLGSRRTDAASIGARLNRGLLQEGLHIKTWNSTTDKLKGLILHKKDTKKVHYDLLKVKPNSKKLRLNILPKHFVKCNNVRMQKLLGWCRIDDVISSSAYIVKSNMKQVNSEEELIDVSRDESSQIYGNFKGDKMSHILLPFTCDFERDNRALFLYTNIIQPSRVGNALAPVLKVIDLNASHMNEQVIVREYDSPVFFPLKGQNIDKIEFRMCNGLGEDYPFQKGEHSIIALKFRRIVKKSQ